MTDTCVLTYIYKDFTDEISSTEQFRKSVAHVGLPLVNCWDESLYWGSMGDIMEMIYQELLMIKAKGKYKYVIYADGADTFFLKAPVFPKEDCIIFSTEKAMWPPEAFSDKEYAEVLPGSWPRSQWKYLNNGIWYGEINKLCEYWRIHVGNLKGRNINGQREQQRAFLEARKNGKANIIIDDKCEWMQSIAFEEYLDFMFEFGGNKNQEYELRSFVNKQTGTTPAILHGNGRTSMAQYYKLLNL